MKRISKARDYISSFIGNHYTEIIFGTYFLLIVLQCLIRNIFDWNSYGTILIAMLAIYTVISIVPKINRGIHKLSFHTQCYTSHKDKIRIFSIASSISIGILLLCYAGCYPGAFSYDSLIQYKQAISWWFNDWHPAYHTFWIFSLPLKLTHGWIGSIVLFQIVYFSLLIGYTALTIYTYAGHRFMYISLAFILLNPLTHNIVMYPWKDVAFAIAACFCMLFAIHIYYTHGTWGNKFYRILLLAFMLASATLFRHNGILFTFFLLVALFLCMEKKRWIILTTLTIVIFSTVKIPIYSYFKVQDPPHRVMETTGFPLSIILNVAKECPDRINEQTEYFVSKMLENKPNWKNYHSIEGFNSIKFKFKDINHIIEETGRIKIIRMMFHCFLVAPKQSFHALIGLTSLVYGLEYACDVKTEIAENTFGIAYQGINIFKDIENKYYSVVYYSPLRFIFLCIGSTILLMLAFILFKSNFKCFEDWKRIFLCIPIFAYDFGTMLFLSGPDVRFFYINFLICPLVVLIMCRKREEEHEA